MHSNPPKTTPLKLSTVILQERSDLIEFCAVIMSQKDVMVEIGSLYGISTKVFARQFKKVYSIDPYLAGYDNNDRNSAAENMQIAEMVFRVRFYDEPNVEQIKQTSIEAVKLFTPESIDFAYIDACHTFTAVCEDIKIWLPKIKPGGYIGGHDINRTVVKEAVDSFFKDNYITLGLNWLARI